MDIPEFYPSVSVYLSHLLDAYGMKKDLRRDRRELFINMEVLKTYTDLVSGKRISNYHFGSQTEAATLLPFDSDVDTLYSLNDFDVKQTRHDWTLDSSDNSYRKYKLVMNSDYSPPGYVRLQVSTVFLFIKIYYRKVNSYTSNQQAHDAEMTSC